MKYYFLNETIKKIKSFERNEEKDAIVMNEIKRLRDSYKYEIDTFFSYNVYSDEPSPLILSNLKRAYERYEKFLRAYQIDMFDFSNKRLCKLYEAIVLCVEKDKESNYNLSCEDYGDMDNAIREFVMLARKNIISKEQTTQKEEKQEDTIQKITQSEQPIQEDATSEEDITQETIETQEKQGFTMSQEDDTPTLILESEEESITSNEEVATQETIEFYIENFEKFEKFFLYNYGVKITKELYCSLIMNDLYFIAFHEKQMTFQERKAKIEKLIQENQESKQEQPIQGDTIEYNFINYIKSIIPMHNIATQEINDNVVFSFSIKKNDLIGFKAPKVYASYEHSQKIKQGQEKARKEGRTPGVKRGAKRERKDKQFIIDQIKALSNSFNGSMNNHELAKLLNCSLNRICSYKREIKERFENSQLNLFTE